MAIVEPEPEELEIKRIYRNGWVWGDETQKKITSNKAERTPEHFPRGDLQNLKGYEYSHKPESQICIVVIISKIGVGFLIFGGKVECHACRYLVWGSNWVISICG